VCPRAAYQSTAIVGADHWAKLDAVTGNALRAHAQATGGTAITRVVELTATLSARGVIWPGLDNPGGINPVWVDSALQLTGLSA